MIFIFLPILLLIAFAFFAYSARNEANERSDMLKLIYTLFLGIMIALFVGFGIATFDPAPKAPEYPTELQYKEPVATETAETIALRKSFDEKQKEFNETMKTYNARVFMYAIMAAIVLLIASLALESHIHLLSDGLLLGGVLTLGYSLIRVFMTDNVKNQFMAVSVGLLISLVLGYLKFIRQPKEK